MSKEAIQTERDYEQALQEISRLMGAQPNTPQGERLDLLVRLAEAWEQEHDPID